MPKTIYFGILHPFMGLIGDAAKPYVNQDDPDGILITPGSLFTKQEHAEIVRGIHFKECEVVPVTISCPEFSLPKTQTEMWAAALEFIKLHPMARLDTKFADFMVLNKFIVDHEWVLWTGFPFSVPFPKMHGGQTYEIILVSGISLKATVDDSREYASEGLEWRTKDGNKPQSSVVAWRLFTE